MSYILGLGSYAPGYLVVQDEPPIDIRSKLTRLDGKIPHASSFFSG